MVLKRCPFVKVRSVTSHLGSTQTVLCTAFLVACIVMRKECETSRIPPCVIPPCMTPLSSKLTKNIWAWIFTAGREHSPGNSCPLTTCEGVLLEYQYPCISLQITAAATSIQSPVPRGIYFLGPPFWSDARAQEMASRLPAPRWLHRSCRPRPTAAPRRGCPVAHRFRYPRHLPLGATGRRNKLASAWHSHILGNSKELKCQLTIQLPSNRWFECGGFTFESKPRKGYPNHICEKHFKKKKTRSLHSPSPGSLQIVPEATTKLSARASAMARHCGAEATACRSKNSHDIGYDHLLNLLLVQKGGGVPNMVGASFVFAFLRIPSSQPAKGTLNQKTRPYLPALGWLRAGCPFD